jgi:hypothetical protein
VSRLGYPPGTYAHLIVPGPYGYHPLNEFSAAGEDLLVVRLCSTPDKCHDFIELVRFGLSGRRRIHHKVEEFAPLGAVVESAEYLPPILGTILHDGRWYKRAPDGVFQANCETKATRFTLCLWSTGASHQMKIYPVTPTDPSPHCPLRPPDD